MPFCGESDQSINQFIKLTLYLNCYSTYHRTATIYLSALDAWCISQQWSDKTVLITFNECSHIVQIEVNEFLSLENSFLGGGGVWQVCNGEAHISQYVKIQLKISRQSLPLLLYMLL